MAEQKPRKPGTGVAFTNKNKKEDWHADWTGEFAALDGTIYYLNVAKRVAGHSGQEYMTVSLGKPKLAKGESSSAPKANFDDLIDDMPF
jgi:hypothetical protein